MRIFAIVILCFLVVFLFYCALGCTMHFKATEMEFDYEQSQTYDLDGVDVFGVPIVKSSGPDKIVYDSGLPKVYGPP